MNNEIYSYLNEALNSPEIAELIPVFTTLFAIISAIAGAVGFAVWLLGAIGIFKMSQSLNIKNGWFAFIYPLYSFALGRVAEKYQRLDGKKTSKLSVWLLSLYILKIIGLCAFLVTLIFAIYKIGLNTTDAIANDKEITFEMFKSVIPAIILYFVSLTISIIYVVIFAVAYWRVCAIFEPQRATLFLTLALAGTFMVGDILFPIFLFAIRNKEPVGIIPNSQIVIE